MFFHCICSWGLWMVNSGSSFTFTLPSFLWKRPMGYFLFYPVLLYSQNIKHFSFLCPLGCCLRSCGKGSCAPLIGMINSANLIIMVLGFMDGLLGWFIDFCGFNLSLVCILLVHLLSLYLSNF